MFNLLEKIYSVHDDIACEVNIVALNIDYDEDKDAPRLELIIKYLEGDKKGTYETVRYATSSDVKGNMIDHELSLRLAGWEFHKDKYQE